MIGSARRECIGRTIVLSETHLRRIMYASAAYYNKARTYLSLGKDEPIRRAIEEFDRIIAEPMVGGLNRPARVLLSVGTGTRPAEQASARLVELLQLWHASGGV